MSLTHVTRHLTPLREHRDPKERRRPKVMRSPPLQGKEAEAKGAKFSHSERKQIPAFPGQGKRSDRVRFQGCWLWERLERRAV